MATQDALDLNVRPMMGSGPYGNAVCHDGTVAVSGTTANGDILRCVRIPAGTRVCKVTLINEQVDSNGAPTLQAKVGYTPVNSTDGPAVNDAYFAAAAARLRTKTAEVLNGQPITFDYDVWLIVTLTAAIATLVSGAKVTLVAEGFHAGTK